MGDNVIGRGRWTGRGGSTWPGQGDVWDDPPGLDPDEWPSGSEWYDERYSPEPGDPDGIPGSLGMMVQITLIEDHVVDTRWLPVSGSDFEWVARRLGRPKVRVTPTPPRHEQELLWLERLVGGSEALGSLDDAPLTDDGGVGVPCIPKAMEARLGAILDRIDTLAPELIEAEGTIAARRFATRLVAARPHQFRDPEADPGTVGAIILAVGRGNGLVGPGKLVLVKDVVSACGLASSPGERARIFASTVSGCELDTGYTRSYGTTSVLVLGSADLLVAAFRRQVIRARDAALRLRAATSA